MTDLHAEIDVGCKLVEKGVGGMWIVNHIADDTAFIKAINTPLSVSRQVFVSTANEKYWNNGKDKPVAGRMSIKAPEPERKHNHYYKDVSKLNVIDVYGVCWKFKVQDDSGCIQHAVKKLLLSGGRGSKDRLTDLNEAVDTLNRLIEIETTYV